MRNLIPLGGAAIVVTVVLACHSTTAVSNACSVAPGTTPAVITMAWMSRPDSLRVLVRGAATISAACAYVRTQAGPNILAGRIVRGAGVDPRVPFHYLPDSVALADAAMELCDSGLLRTAAEVDAYFLGSTGRVDAPSAPYCPWDARPVRVGPATGG